MEKKLTTLFQLSDLLDNCLNNKNFELFQTLEQEFSAEMKHFLDKKDQQTLLQYLPQLKMLEKRIRAIQEKAAVNRQSLKDQSLLQKRNKNKLKAYK